MSGVLSSVEDTLIHYKEVSNMTTTYTKHTPTKEPKKTYNNHASFGFYLRTGVPYNPRMSEREKKALISRR